MVFFLNYTLPFIILLAAELFYFKIADHYNIVDKPNERSSHSVTTIRGGGIIFLLAAILFFFYSHFKFPFFIAALLISGIISFLDDIQTLNNRLKFTAHIISVILIFAQLNLLTNFTLYLFVLGVVILGIINAYNFMDGINGITGLYSLAIILPLFFTENNDDLKLLEFFSIAGLLVFNFFNTRKNARCFAGDVGSISLAIIVIFLLLIRIQAESNLIYMALLSLYGLDSIFTILQRLIHGENIFKPHRKHLYQYLSNEGKIPQLWISAAYATIQFFINLLVVYKLITPPQFLLLLLFLTFFYFLLKRRFLFSVHH